jgi:hypothetical protein
MSTQLLSGGVLYRGDSIDARIRTDLSESTVRIVGNSSPPSHMKEALTLLTVTTGDS